MLYLGIKKKKDMNIRKQFMDDLMLNRDHEILETVINSIYKELSEEGFDKDDISKFVLVKVREYLASVK